MRTIFYSWQSDRPTGVCRNFIERALQSAIDRLRADVEIEPSLREDLELDKDTKNTPGSPAIFDTIMAKIATASVFIPDLTFVGQRENERLVSNPNVLIEYGCALRKPGPGRIIAVMNEAYGKPTGSDMPFNLQALSNLVCVGRGGKCRGDKGCPKGTHRLTRVSVTDDLQWQRIQGRGGGASANGPRHCCHPSKRAGLRRCSLRHSVR